MLYEQCVCERGAIVEEAVRARGPTPMAVVWEDVLNSTRSNSH